MNDEFFEILLDEDTIKLYNPNHDKNGRFASKGGRSSAAIGFAGGGPIGAGAAVIINKAGQIDPVTAGKVGGAMGGGLLPGLVGSTVASNSIAAGGGLIGSTLKGGAAAVGTVLATVGLALGSMAAVTTGVIAANNLMDKMQTDKEPKTVKDIMVNDFVKNSNGKPMGQYITEKYGEDNWRDLERSLQEELNKRPVDVQSGNDTMYLPEIGGTAAPITDLGIKEPIKPKNK